MVRWLQIMNAASETKMMFVILCSLVMLVQPSFGDTNTENNEEHNIEKPILDYIAEWDTVNQRNRRNDLSPSEESWTGRWLPERTTHSPKTTTVDLRDPVHGIKMGIPSDSCDDGHVNITLDWDKSPVNHTCYNPSHLYIPDPELPARLEYENIPKSYVPAHVCMDSKIEYDHPIPTFGNHRPLWARYGEYKFLPKQRWLHNIEHGAVVMLYHPCANPVEVNRLRKLVVNCIRKHIITPYTLLEERRPMALVSWGVRLTMSIVDPDVVRAFIREKAKHGPEGLDSRDGHYDVALEVPAIVPSGSDSNDSLLCPYQ